jgi:hypothetical protein
MYGLINNEELGMFYILYTIHFYSIIGLGFRRDGFGRGLLRCRLLQ